MLYSYTDWFSAVTEDLGGKMNRVKHVAPSVWLPGEGPLGMLVELVPEGYEASGRDRSPFDKGWSSPIMFYLDIMSVLGFETWSWSFFSIYDEPPTLVNQSQEAEELPENSWLLGKIERLI